MKKLSLLAVLLCAAFAHSAAQELQFKPYGFLRSYFAYDSRVSSAGTGDLYYYMPLDENIVDGTDLNAASSFRFTALTSRLGLDILGYEIDGYKFSGKFEGDFYAGLSGSTGTAQFRLRQAFVTVSKNGRSWKVGQAWHPMAADLPDIFSLESGAPFGPFSRTPLVQFDWKAGKAVTLTAAAIWQMQYTSTGPNGASADYIKYGCTPEIYAGISLKSESGSILKVGADVLSIKPRQVASNTLVSDRLTTWNAFVYGSANAGGLDLKSKITYANDGSHFNMVGGYGVRAEDGKNWEYTATRNLSGWLSAAYRKCGRWVPQMMLGYTKLFGTPESLATVDGGLKYWFKNNADSIDSMFRVQPELMYNLGKLGLGAEYMLTGVMYGDKSDRIVADGNLHMVLNHRVQLLFKYNF
ncbi:MAG: hypothetical protein J1D85_02655 [Bacteroidales bacterium]|nr:hypothetical protein [Bacteroidales bacterium]